MKPLGYSLLLGVIIAALSPCLYGQEQTLSSAEATQATDEQSERQSPFATSNCSYTFTSGNNNSNLNYCVTVNGNIPQIETPIGHPQIGFSHGEGYGICNESPAVEYHDYANSDSGNWNPATTVSLTKAAVRIARTTSDGHWTLTQTITKAPKTASITIVMALTNNQAADKQAYLIRYMDVNADGKGDFDGQVLGATLNSAFAWSFNERQFTSPPFYGLQLQNVGISPFGFWQAYVKYTNDGPNACDFAAHDMGGFARLVTGSFVMAYVGLVPAHQTKTVTVNYRGL